MITPLGDLTNLRFSSLKGVENVQLKLYSIYSYSTIKIANSVAIIVLEGSRVDLVVDGGLPPGQDLSAVCDSKEKHGNTTQALHVVGFS